ncbi:hypothetical protein [Pseudoxanthomonas sacheonensis]|uniref:hypothetical protein n=1 Tax=Pseudoxanthomonas sacheonensis TaxID=443615 RepID=UPI0013CFCB9A|nr:hypothetical protein [Pseudoxanthomonas sacheonensis]KAF1706938.1 hypothetical protein CSC73_14060 [Pseudoxanthomonas sacheonensis]
MSEGQLPVPQTGSHSSTDRKRAARICSVACIAVLLLLSAALVYAHAGVGCYLGVILMAASALLLGGSALVLLVVSVWLRPAELFWLGIAGLPTAFATGLALQLLPAVVCGYPG